MARAGFCFTLLAAGLVRLVAISFCVSVFASCCLCPCVVDKTEGQALEAARRSRKLAPQIPDAILYEGIALIGMSQNAEAIDVLQAALTDASGLKWQRIDTSRPDEGCRCRTCGACQSHAFHWHVAGTVPVQGEDGSPSCPTDQVRRLQGASSASLAVHLCEIHEL